jgi:drug/metabolite transporter (DMT)-like permease
MVLFSALLWSINIIITKKISKDDSAITILAYQSIFMSLLSFFIVLFFWEMPSLKTFVYLILAAMCGTVLHLTLNHAFKLVDVSMTQPYSFLNLVFASIIGYFVFDEIPFYRFPIDILQIFGLQKKNTSRIEKIQTLQHKVLVMLKGIPDGN